MKKILCGYDKCWTRRPHHERPDETREHRLCEVAEDYTGKAFCSIECACYAGYFHVQRGWIRDPKTGEPIAS